MKQTIKTFPSLFALAFVLVAVAPSVVLGKPFAVRAAQIAVLAPFAGVGGLARADTVVTLPSIHAISKTSTFTAIRAHPSLVATAPKFLRVVKGVVALAQTFAVAGTGRVLQRRRASRLTTGGTSPLKGTGASALFFRARALSMAGTSFGTDGLGTVLRHPIVFAFAHARDALAVFQTIAIVQTFNGLAILTTPTSITVTFTVCAFTVPTTSLAKTGQPHGFGAVETRQRFAGFVPGGAGTTVEAKFGVDGQCIQRITFRIVLATDGVVFTGTRRCTHAFKEGVGGGEEEGQQGQHHRGSGHLGVVGERRSN